ncbi:MAG: pectin esterase [Rheinheimera sp.]|nr:MAG: pectin esterase [Rheinheimera sp.]
MRVAALLLVVALLSLVGQPLALATETAAPLRLQVDPVGGPYRSIQQALDSLPTSGPDAQRWALIRIAPGLYREQLFLKRDKVVLAGSGLSRTIIQYPILRQHFLAARNSSALPSGKDLEKDWGAAVVNIAASDIQLLDLTVHNSYAFENPQDPARFEHQFAVRGFAKASRIITDQSQFASNGADTMSLWNKQNGMYLHRQSFFSGRVDLLCPRGSALVLDSDFVNYNQAATLWHDGELAASQQLVVLNSHFHGVTDFQLGRRHYDGQFVLASNKFSSALADQPIFRRTYPNEPQRDQPNRYGDRNFYAQNQGPAYTWLADNFSPAQQSAYADAQSASMTIFGERWQPLAELARSRAWLHHK